jgi:uncharacterized protein YgbK (DUF1537 family)
MSSKRLNRTKTLAALPAEWASNLMPEIQCTIRESHNKVVVLDDDPTGTQTVHNVSVLTGWSIDVLVQELNNPSPAMFVLTNSRSMTTQQAQSLNREIATNLKEASSITGRNFVIISRSDSTLRGHFPAETDTLAEYLPEQPDAVLIIPAFMAGGRFTINGVHYVAEGDELIPASETPFAQDVVFGYTSSDLREWVVEKTNQRVEVDEVHSITLDTIRKDGVNGVYQGLMTLENNAYCVIDSVTERDLEVVVAGILKAEHDGKHLMYRTAASFASIRAGITLRELLTSDELRTTRGGGGLIVVGSYVPKSSIQLEHLLASGEVNAVEVDVSQLLDNSSNHIEIERVITEAIPYLQANQNVVIYTSRKLITGDSVENSLAIGNRVSDSLVRITSALQSHARYIIAKGGITSSDLATKSLKVKRAMVIGQILPGIPVWKLDDNCEEPNMIYVVFPGNVGSEDAITTAIRKFEGG